MSAFDHPHVSRSVYYRVYAALAGLLALTIGVAFTPMGIFNLPVALAIAIVKAILVVLFFMHVRYTSRWIWIASAIGFVWLLYLLVGTLGDILTRSAG